MTDFSSIDFTEPHGLSPGERVAWLREVGAKLTDATGQRSGQTPPIDVGTQQPVWFMWWGEDDERAAD